MSKKCTVRFFELRLLPDDVPAAGQQWSAIMRSLETTTNCSIPGAHEIEYNKTLIQGVSAFESKEPGAALSIDRSVTPRQRNRRTAERSDLPIDEDHEAVEETFVSFFGDNVIGLVQSTISAPSHVAVGCWLNQVAPPRFAGPDALWHVAPIINPEKYREIADAQEVTGVTFAVKPENVPAEYGTLLGGFLEESLGVEQGVRIEVKISTGRGRPGESTLQAFGRIARRLVGMREAGVDLEKATANIRRQYGEAVEPIDILHHRLARSVEVPVTDGLALNQQAVFRETRQAYRDLRDDILRSIGMSV